MSIIAENDRIVLRECNQTDFQDLKEMLMDPTVMYAYEEPFSEAQVQDWLNWLLDSYEEHGFGSWAIIDKDTQNMVGECGIVWSKVEEINVMEIGYHLKKQYFGKGYAKEAAFLCKEYARQQLVHQSEFLHAIIRDSNDSSMKIAKTIGMERWKSFDENYSGVKIPHNVYRVSLI